MTKTVIVTGAARGIGRATTRLFIAEGWQVAMIDRDSEALDDAGPIDGAKPFVCDVSAPDAVSAMTTAVAAWAGRLDALVGARGEPSAAADEDFRCPVGSKWALYPRSLFFLITAVPTGGKY